MFDQLWPIGPRLLPGATVRDQPHLRDEMTKGTITRGPGVEIPLDDRQSKVMRGLVTRQRSLMIDRRRPEAGRARGAVQEEIPTLTETRTGSLSRWTGHFLTLRER